MKLSCTLRSSPRSGLFIRRPLMTPNFPSSSTSLPLASSSLHHLQQEHHPAQERSRLTIPSTWPSSPNDPLQPGPMYFLTPMKCAIFGVCCEALPRQVNYLIDEAVDTGKGANSIISMFHHFFEVHGLGEREVHLHADNCGGQNKNSAMVGYLLWRVLTGLHTSITLSFMITGHTKFSPDWCFGLLKKR